MIMNLQFNYAGRIIGPKGAYLKAIMRETMTKMVLLGQGVMKDKEKVCDL
jgi:rRNA processing protein Krr1/Pno1